MTADRSSASVLAIVVVNFGSSTLLSGNLLPTAQDVQPDHVVVVDCYSTEEERQDVLRLSRMHGWETVALPDNRGFGGGMNAGVGRALELGATEFLLLNPDAQIDASSVRRLRARVHSDPALLVSPRIETPDGRAWFTGSDVYLEDGTTRAATRRGERPEAQRWEWVSGACLMMSAQLWHASEGFDESYFLYWEDVDLSRRVVAAGGRLGVDAEALAVHDEGGTHTDPGSDRGRSGTYYRYMIRNRLLFASKHLDAGSIRKWRRSAMRNAWQTLLHGGRRQFLHPVGPVRSALRGLREGRSLASAALRELEGKTGT